MAVKWPKLPVPDVIDPSQLTNMGSFTLQGDIRSFNWDGGSDLSSQDIVATAGFYFDSSVGAAQFMGDIFVGGDISLEAGGKLLTDIATNERLEISNTDRSRIYYYSNDGDESSRSGIVWDLVTPGGSTADYLRVDIEAGSLDAVLPDVDIELHGVTRDDSTDDAFIRFATRETGDSSTTDVLQMKNGQLKASQAGTVSLPSYAWNAEAALGFYRQAAGVIGVTAAGINYLRLGDDPHLQIAFTNASDIGITFWESSFSGRSYQMRRGASFGTFEFAALTSGAALTVSWIVDDDGIFFIPENYNNTTGDAADVVIESSGELKLSTSARRYKQDISYDVDYLADIELKPSKHYRLDDERWFYGFVAEDIADQDPLLGVWNDNELMNYDGRQLVAVMAAKINRLDRQVAVLEAANG